MRAFNAGANLAAINLTPRSVRADYPIYKRDRIIMDEQQVLTAIAEAGCNPSRVSIADHLRTVGQGLHLETNPELRMRTEAASTLNNLRSTQNLYAAPASSPRKLRQPSTPRSRPQRPVVTLVPDSPK